MSPLHTDAYIHTARFSGSTGVQVTIAYGRCVVGLLADLPALCLHRLGMLGAWGFHILCSLGYQEGQGWVCSLMVQVGECFCGLGPVLGGLGL